MITENWTENFTNWLQQQQQIWDETKSFQVAFKMSHDAISGVNSPSSGLNTHTSFNHSFMIESIDLITKWPGPKNNNLPSLILWARSIPQDKDFSLPFIKIIITITHNLFDCFLPPLLCHDFFKKWRVFFLIFFCFVLFLPSKSGKNHFRLSNLVRSLLSWLNGWERWGRWFFETLRCSLKWSHILWDSQKSRQMLWHLPRFFRRFPSRNSREQLNCFWLC